MIMTDQYKNLKAEYHTLGCKLNFSETSAIGKMLSEKGILRAAKGDTPDIVVINTCSVTETADKKGRQLIRRLSARYPEAAIVVTGCYAQLKPGEI
ncbi:MAG: tRNA (N(6)-L-threonylcarbamoyladenosine(37)-C(2))-methylthiotransferase MtaB, partial [Muribaculaceae bacterium]|nr:tRNA (N(6)-L-threonylcarbamoyladenosine(37)-C(2))-methylthiotransferase MtaB [Muribaculaceae bacterium]